jgi:hypothetical protein
VCAHLGTPGLGVEGSSTLPAGHWEASVFFRYYNSRQDVLGDTPLDHPIVYANTHVYGFTVSATYAVTDRFDLTLDFPFQYGTRQTWIEHNFMSMTLHTMRAGGIGDMRLSASYWLFDPKKSPNRNVSLSLGVSMPTGVDDAEDFSYRARRKELRPVDPAIQPGNGAWGILVGGHAFTSLSFPQLPHSDWFVNTYAYAEGAYVITPQETNGVQSTIGDEPLLTGGFKGFIFDSVPDQFLVRAGVAQVVWPSKGVSISAGIRWEGVPPRDLIGGDLGWRLPGYSLSFEPGVTWSPRRQDSFSVYVPIAVHRHAGLDANSQSMNMTGPGLATIADWQLIVSYTHQF